MAYDDPQLVELGDEDAPQIAALGAGVDPALRWVGVRQDGLLVAAAGWRCVAEGVRLVALAADPPWWDALLGAVAEVGAADCPAGRLSIAESAGIDAAGLRALGFTEENGRFVRDLPAYRRIPTAEAMIDLGRRLAARVRPGDVLILNGDLGAGKTTLAQGIGAGLGVEGPVTSPTFVLAQIHPGRAGGPDLVHVDAYRLDHLDEIDDIDLDSGVDHSVTVIEWGAGVAEQLSADRLEIDIRRGDDPADEERVVVLQPIGVRWAGFALDGDAG